MKKQTKPPAETAVAALQKGLIEAGVVRIASTENEPPLVRAVMAGNLTQVCELIASGANPNEANKANRNSDNFLGEPPLVHAIRRGKVEIAEALLKAGADARYKPLGRSLLAFAIWEQQYKCVPLLLQWGADVNSKRRGVPSPLEAAIDRGSLESFRLLLEHGADPTAPASDGGCILTNVLFSYKSAASIPAHFVDLPGFAEKVKNAPALLEIARDILKRRPDVNRADRNGSTPLIPACAAAPFDIIEEILKLGGNPNVELNAKHMDAGLRPVHCAILGDRVEVLALLQHFDADFDKPLPDGSDLLQFAQKHEAPKAIDYFQMRAAR